MELFIFILIVAIIIYIIIYNKKYKISNNNYAQNSSEYTTPLIKSTPAEQQKAYQNIQKTHTKLNTNYPEDYYDFEYKYHDKVVTKIDKYIDTCEITFEKFEENFSIKYRISQLQKCIDRLKDVQDYCQSMGKNGVKLYQEITTDEYSEIYQTWIENKIIKTNSENSYEFEFAKIPCCYNYNFLINLLHLYEDDFDNQEKHLKQEKYFYDIEMAGGIEEYNLILEYEKEMKQLKSFISKEIKKSDGILQSDLIKLVNEDQKNMARKIINELYEKGNITKTKEGRSYILKSK